MHIITSIIHLSTMKTLLLLVTLLGFSSALMTKVVNRQPMINEEYYHCTPYFSPQKYIAVGRIVAPVEPHLCSYDPDVANMTKTSIKDRIVIAKEGSCPVTSQIFVAQKFGAMALIIGLNSNALYVNIPENIPSTTIPVVYVIGATYDDIIQALGQPNDTIIGFVINTYYNSVCRDHRRPVRPGSGKIGGDGSSMTYAGKVPSTPNLIWILVLDPLSVMILFAIIAISVKTKCCGKCRDRNIVEQIVHHSDPVIELPQVQVKILDPPRSLGKYKQHVEQPLFPGLTDQYADAIEIRQ
jgi:hypothetical protein